MYLYNIHTHAIGRERESEFDVKYILNTYPEDFREKKQLNAGKNVYFSCGIHPWYASNASFTMLEEAINDERTIAVGEVGLDKLQGPELHQQIAVFRKQIEMAISAHKPLIIHCVKAWDELIALYKEYKGEVPWIIHGYRGAPQQANQLSKIGFKFSIGEKFNRDSLKNLPLNSIFCETDVSLVSICQVYENISQEMGLNLNHFAILAEENIKRTFQQMTI